MRDYLEPALKYLTKVVPHPSAMKAYMTEHRAFTYMTVAGLLIIVTSTLLFARHIMVADAKQNSTSETTHARSISATAPDQSADGIHTSQQVINTVSPDGRAKTNIAVNGQNIAIPQNGSFHKTIKTENGTTSMDVTVNGDSTNSNTSSISTNLQVMSDNITVDQRSEFRTP